MTIDDETALKIRRLFFAEHWPVGTIATQVDVHPDVVKRVAGLLSDKRVVPPPQSSPLLAAHRDFIHDTLTQYPTLRATRVFDMMVNVNYFGSSSGSVQFPTPRAVAAPRGRASLARSTAS